MDDRQQPKSDINPAPRRRSPRIALRRYLGTQGCAPRSPRHPKGQRLIEVRCSATLREESSELTATKIDTPSPHPMAIGCQFCQFFQSGSLSFIAAQIASDRQPLPCSLLYPARRRRPAHGLLARCPSHISNDNLHAPLNPLRQTMSLHQLGVIAGLTAGVWLGAAESSILKAVNIGLSPFSVSLCMVAGVFTCWTFLYPQREGTSCAIRRRPRLPAKSTSSSLGCSLAGPLGMANTLTVYLRSAMSASPSPFPCAEPRQLHPSASSGAASSSAGANGKVIARVLLGTWQSSCLVSIMLGFSGAAAAQPASARCSGHLPSIPSDQLHVGHHADPLPQGLSEQHEPLSFVTAFTRRRARNVLVLA